MPIVNGISDSLTCIPDSKAKDLELTSKNFPDSGFHDQKFPRRIPESRFSDMEWPNQGLARVNMHLSIHPSWNS